MSKFLRPFSNIVTNPNIPVYGKCDGNACNTDDAIIKSIVKSS